MPILFPGPVDAGMPLPAKSVIQADSIVQTRSPVDSVVLRFGMQTENQQSSSMASQLMFQVVESEHKILVSPSVDPSLTTKRLQAAAEYLINRSDQETHWSWAFSPGTYSLERMIRIEGLKNVSMVSNPKQPARLVKASGWNAKNGEFLLAFVFGGKLQFSGFTIEGMTNFANDPKGVWPDQGILFGSCDTVDVTQNLFKNIGNAALRVITHPKDKVFGVNSFNTRVLNNTFNNIYQISTTSDDATLKHGGTKNYLLQDNTFINLRGSAKFASRTAGAEGVKIINNQILSGSNQGFEIVNYNDVEIRDNLIQILPSVGINVYTGADRRIAKGFDWGDGIVITGNTLKNVGRGIRYSHEPFHDGHQNVPRRVLIERNILNKVTEKAPGVSAILVMNGTIEQLEIRNNQLSGVTNKQYISVRSVVKKLLQENNQRK